MFVVLTHFIHILQFLCPELTQVLIGVKSSSSQVVPDTVLGGPGSLKTSIIF